MHYFKCLRDTYLRLSVGFVVTAENAGRGSMIRNCEDNSRTSVTSQWHTLTWYSAFTPHGLHVALGEPRESRRTRNRFFQRTIEIHVHTTWHPNTSMPPPPLLASPRPLPHWDMHLVSFYLEPKPKAQSSVRTIYRVVEVIAVELKQQKHKNNVVPIVPPPISLTLFVKRRRGNRTAANGSNRLTRHQKYKGMGEIVHRYFLCYQR